jgi:hypothetical protein
MRIAADNLNVLHPRISEALRMLDPEPLQEMARLCEQAGAGLDLGLINVLYPEVQPLARTIHSTGEDPSNPFFIGHGGLTDSRD